MKRDSFLSRRAFFSAVLLLILYTSLSGQRTHRVGPENCRKCDCLRCWEAKLNWLATSSKVESYPSLRSSPFFAPLGKTSL